MGRCIRALEVYPNDAVPVRLAHREDHAVPEDASIVDQDVEATKGVHGLIDHGFGFGEIRDVCAVDDCLAAHRLDLFDNLLGWTGVGPGTIGGTTEIVNNDLGAM